MFSIPKIVIKYILKNETKNNKKVKYKIVEDQNASNFPATQEIDRIQREEKIKLATT